MANREAWTNHGEHGITLVFKQVHSFLSQHSNHTQVRLKQAFMAKKLARIAWARNIHKILGQWQPEPGKAQLETARNLKGAAPISGWRGCSCT